MIKIGELGTRNVITVDPDRSVAEVAALMRESNVGNVVVTSRENGAMKPLGIVTDRDIVYQVVATGLDPRAFTAADVMSPDLVTAMEDDDLMTVVRRMGVQGVRRIPIVDGEEKLVAIFAMDDAIEQLTGEMEDLLLLIRRQRRPGMIRREVA